MWRARAKVLGDACPQLRAVRRRRSRACVRLSTALELSSEREGGGGRVGAKCLHHLRKLHCCAADDVRSAQLLVQFCILHLVLAQLRLSSPRHHCFNNIAEATTPPPRCRITSTAARISRCSRESCTRTCSQPNPAVKRRCSQQRRRRGYTPRTDSRSACQRRVGVKDREV